MKRSPLRRNTPLKRGGPLKRTAFKRKPQKPLNRIAPASKIKEELDDLIKAIIKIRDNFTCQKCGEKVEGSNCHGSHVVPVSAGNKLRWDEQNLKVLCYHHHINWWHKHPLEAAAWFEATFPERAAYLKANEGTKKFYREDMLALKEKFEARLAEIKNG